MSSIKLQVYVYVSVGGRCKWYVYVCSVIYLWRSMVYVRVVKLCETMGVYCLPFFPCVGAEEVRNPSPPTSDIMYVILFRGIFGQLTS